MQEPLTILVADDNPEDRARIMRELRRDFAALRMAVAVDEDTLQKALGQNHFHVVITDYKLNWTDGLAILHRVKARWPNCPVIMFTATAPEEITIAALNSGLDDYVVKCPRHLIRLRAVVRAVVAQAEESHGRQASEDLVHLQSVALEAAANAILITGRDGTIEWVNPAFTQLTGYGAEEVLGQNPRILKSDRHPPEFFRQIWNTILAGETWRGEFINRRKDGSYYTEEQIITPVRNRQGEIAHFIGIKQDVTQRKEAEQALQEHLRLKELIADVSVALTRDQSLAAMLRSCTEPIVRHLGVAFARIWTLSQKRDLLELQAGSGLHSQFDLKFNRIPVGQNSIGRIAQTRQALLTNLLLEDPLLQDQEWVRQEGLTAFAGHPLIVSGRLVGVMALFSRRSLTQIALRTLGAVADQVALGIERKRAEEALRLSEQRYRYLIETAPDVIGTVTPEGLISSANSAFERVFNWPVSEWLGRPFSGLIYPEDLSRAMQNFSQVLRGEIPPVLEIRCLSRTGNLIDVEVSITPQIQEGKVIGALVVVRDVTARKRLQAQFLQAQKMEAVGRLAGGVAHDFNNLLTIINGYSEMLAGMVRNEEKLLSIVEEIHKAGERAAGLTQRLLAFSRKQVIIPQVLDLNLVITELEKMLHRLIGEDIQLITRLHPSLRPIKADPNHIESIIVNLAVNARDAMPDGGQMIIETSNQDLDAAAVRRNPKALPGAFVLLSITDTGTGIPAEVMPSIFEPFFTTKGPGKGTGLGLATVQEIVLQSGGIIQVSSEFGRGTTFRIYFPQPEDIPLAVPARPSGFDVRLRGTETLLLVEDDEGVRALARLVLQTRGYTVLEARHGEEALRVCDQHAGPIQMVVSDLVMPGLSGRNLLAKLQEARPGIKVLFMSGYLDDAVAQHGIVESGLPFLQKPFTPDSLAGKVREILDEK